MNESVKQGLKIALYLAWIMVVGLALVRDIQRTDELSRSIQHTQAMTDELALASHGIVDSTRLIRGGSRDVQFLQGLVSLLPQNKSFIRTQHAMMDEVESLRYKVGRRVKDDLHILVDTKANNLYV